MLNLIKVIVIYINNFKKDDIINNKKSRDRIEKDQK